MNFTMNIPGLKDVTIQKVEETGERIALHVSLPKKAHSCPNCHQLMSKVHDYRVQKIKHLKWFERLTILFYKRRRYACKCGKRFSEKSPFVGQPVIVADGFHYCRYIYWALDEVRRQVQKEWHEYDRKKCKRMRHVLYKRQEKLTKTNAWYLARYTNMSETLKQAHELKEAYCKWFDWAKETKDLVEVKKQLEAFYRKVEDSKIPAFIKAIRTFKNWQTEILNSFSFGYSNGFLEGINNKTKVMKRNAYGFRRFDHFRAKILLNIKYKEIGVHLG